MPKQDPRFNQDMIELIPGFFGAIARNDNARIQRYLVTEPTLIYARHLEIGNTAIVHLLVLARPQDFETLTIILETTLSRGFRPDFTLTNNHNTNARDAYNSIGNPEIQAQMNQVLLEHGFNILDVAPAPTAAYTEAQRAELVERESKYADTSKKAAKVIKKIEDGTKIKPGKKDEDEGSTGGGKGGEKCIVSIALDEPYMNNLVQQLEKLQPNSMDQKKSNNQELFNPFGDMSFAPISFESSSFGDFSIVVIPKELIGFSFEQIKGIIGMIYNYFADTE